KNLAFNMKSGTAPPHVETGFEPRQIAQPGCARQGGPHLRVGLQRDMQSLVRNVSQRDPTAPWLIVVGHGHPQIWAAGTGHEIRPLATAATSWPPSACAVAST